MGSFVSGILRALLHPTPPTQLTFTAGTTLAVGGAPTASSGSLMGFFVTKMPLSWPQGLEYRAAWRRSIAHGVTDPLQTIYTTPTTPQHQLAPYTRPAPTPHHAHHTTHITHTTPLTPHHPRHTTHSAPPTSHHPFHTTHASPPTQHHPFHTTYASPRTLHHALHTAPGSSSCLIWLARLA